MISVMPKVNCLKPFMSVYSWIYLRNLPLSDTEIFYTEGDGKYYLKFVMSDGIERVFRFFTQVDLLVGYKSYMIQYLKSLRDSGRINQKEFVRYFKFYELDRIK